MSRLPLGTLAGASPPAPAGAARDLPGFAVLDVETTGTHPGRDRVVEVAVVLTDAEGWPQREWSTLVHPGQPSVGPTHVHGIGPDDVLLAPPFAAVAGALAQLLAGRVVVAHSARFDTAVLRAEFARTGVLLPDLPQLCTLRASWRHLPLLRSRRLGDCCGALGVTLREAHTALGDARATAGLLRRYLELDAARGDERTAELLARAAALPWPAVPVTAVDLLPRPRPGARTSAPGRLAPPGRMAALVRALPDGGAAAADGAVAPGAAEYRALLARALPGTALAAAAADRLESLARERGLRAPEVAAAHHDLLRERAAALAGAAGRRAESELAALADVLGAAPDDARAALETARAQRLERAAAAAAPLPGDWALGEPLRVGQRVAFTGCDDVERAHLERRTRDAGLAVAGAVSRTTALLVTDDPASGTVKARAAREAGLRTVGPAEYAALLDHVQPAAPERAATHPSAPAAFAARSGRAARRRPA